MTGYIAEIYVCNDARLCFYCMQVCEDEQRGLFPRPSAGGGPRGAGHQQRLFRLRPAPQQRVRLLAKQYLDIVPTVLFVNSDASFRRTFDLESNAYDLNCLHLLCVECDMYMSMA